MHISQSDTDESRRETEIDPLLRSNIRPGYQNYVETQRDPLEGAALRRDEGDRKY
jgi:hypothetical protein